jgi:DNA polymerase III subunit delta'
MKSIQWKKFVGQDRVKQVLSTAFSNNSLGHAYLFCGDEGCGTFAAALELAMAVLCTSDSNVPCYECDSCLKIARHSHPDFNLVFPIFVQKEHRNSDNDLSQKGWDLLSQRAQERIRDPYLIIQEKGNPTIPVEWIREVNGSINRGVIGDSTHVAILCGVDLMNKESANTLLKTLEEPPEHTLMILCTSRPHDVLPTIRSRCQILRFGLLPSELITAAIQERSTEKLSADAIEAIAAAAQGSLGTAIQMIETPLDQAMNQARELWQLSQSTDRMETTRKLDEIIKGTNFADAERLLLCMLYLVRSSFLGKFPEAEKYISTVFNGANGESINADQAQRLTSACEEALHALRANGNSSIILVHCALTMMEILHGEKQQNR